MPTLVSAPHTSAFCRLHLMVPALEACVRRYRSKPGGYTECRASLALLACAGIWYVVVFPCAHRQRRCNIQNKALRGALNCSSVENAGLCFQRTWRGGILHDGFGACCRRFRNPESVLVSFWSQNYPKTVPRPGCLNQSTTRKHIGDKWQIKLGVRHHLNPKLDRFSANRVSGHLE